MDILVTGASGLVGGAIWDLLRRKNSVIATGRREIKDENYIKCDLFSEDLDKTINIKKYDYIVHSAACIPGKKSDDDCYNFNKYIDSKIFDLAKKNGSKVIYISSALLYGLSNIEIKKDENSDIVFLSKYHKGKFESENELFSICPNSYIFRIPSPFGYKQETKNVVKLFIENVANKKNIFYYGTGKRTMNYIYVNDIASAVEKAILTDKYGIYNIASENSLSMIELALLVEEAFEEVLGYRTEVLPSGMYDSQDDCRFSMDISKAEYNLGWKPQISVKDGVKDWVIKGFCK